MRHPYTLDKNQTALVIVDLQEAFRSPIPDFAEIAVRASIAVRGFSILEIPILVTEQYPKGLGRTAEEILLTLPASAQIFEKTTFSSCLERSFDDQLKSTGASQVVLCGIETHICVNQTAHDLLSRGYQVHLLQDCVSSRTSHDKHTGIEKMRLSGVIPANLEMALFELVGDSAHPAFKDIQSLIK